MIRDSSEESQIQSVRPFGDDGKPSTRCTVRLKRRQQKRPLSARFSCQKSSEPGDGKKTPIRAAVRHPQSKISQSRRVFPIIFFSRFSQDFRRTGKKTAPAAVKKGIRGSALPVETERGRASREKRNEQTYVKLYRALLRGYEITR